MCACVCVCVCVCATLFPRVRRRIEKQSESCGGERMSSGGIEKRHGDTLLMMAYRHCLGPKPPPYGQVLGHLHVQPGLSTRFGIAEFAHCGLDTDLACP